MSTDAWRERITVDPQVCHGRPCIHGTRVWVSLILDNLAAEMPEEEILAAYPALTHEDIVAAKRYAADLAHDHYVPLEGAG